MKKHRRIITMILAMLLVISAAVFVSAASEEQEVVRLGEVQALRETNSETYLLSDGSYECVVYAQDKYYLDDADTLQLIDHTIKAQTSGLNTTYTNTAGSFDATFSGSGTPQVSITYEGNSVTFSPLCDISLDDPITANDHVARIGQVDNCLTLENITPTGSNTVTYEEVFTATDLVYVLDNDGVKEYIILNSTDAPNEFSFMFQMDGVEMQTIDNETFFMDAEGKSVFQLGQLFAVDGADELTNELTYSFTPVKGTSNVIVTVTLSEDYLAAPDRVFPVVIDPSIMISSVQTADACVLSYYADTNYYTSSYLRTGYDSDYGIRRSFIRFDIPSSIPEDSVTESLLYFEKCGGVAPTMRAHRCILPWESATLTWNNQPLYNTTHDLSYSPLAERYSPTSAWYVLDVTNIVASWVDGLRSNYGFALVDITEDDEDHWTTYYSSDMESPHKPELHITYNGPSTPDEPDDPVNPPATTPTQGISSGQTYYIKNAFSGKYLEADASLNNNAIQNDFDGYSNQQWKVVYQGNGVYKLYNQYAGYINDRCCLDLVSQNDNGIDLYADSNSPRVLFYILLNSDGSFRIQNSWATTEAVLTVPDALSLSDVTNSDWVNSSKQKWVFELATTKLSSYRTFSAFDIGDSSEDEVSLVSQYLTNYGYTNLGTYNNADHYISAQNIKDIGRYSDVVYINGHGEKYANLRVQYDGDGDGIIDEIPIEYLCADEPVNTKYDKPTTIIGAQWKPGSTTKTTSYWNQKTKWVILAECSQLNYGTEEGAGNHWNGLNSAQVWARTMLGDGVRIHGILGYYEYAPAADAHLAKLENFFNTSSQVSIIKAWKSVHNTLVGTANWAMLYHSENSSDRLSSFTENTTNGSDYTIYLVSRSHDTETDLSLSVLAMPTNISVDLNDFPTFINTSTYNAQSIYESMKSKLPLGNNEQLTIDEFGKITYLNSSVDLGSADLNYLLTDEEAIDIAERYLLQLGIFPEGSYRTSVNKTERRTLNLIDNQFSSPEVIEYSVCFYRTYNGIDLLSDQDDGIIVSFNKEGLTELKYLWREIELVTNGQDERMEALSMNQGVMISKEQAQDIYRNNIDELLSGNITEPVITTAYLQLNNTVRPVYVFSTDYHYANSIFIDMYTGEVLVV